MVVGVKSLWHLCLIEFIGKSEVKLYFKMSIVPPLQLFSLVINSRCQCQLDMYEGYVVFQIYGHFLPPPYMYSLKEDAP